MTDSISFVAEHVLESELFESKMDAQFTDEWKY